ncbi:hypothetical protein QTP86_016765 [Hemibagrus guttatus]|nr:hypothetical protein QTP86_016765 [Hemibagrus guttatus]
MDTVKVWEVTEWPAPATVRELQRFLGFANFYRRFIRNYSSVAGPLTLLLRGKPKRLAWSDQARVAFQQLKNCFTTVPILRHPDPDLPFVVEVDASSSGLGLYSPSVMVQERKGGSRQFEVASEPVQADLILPATTILALVQWNPVEEIRRTHADKPPPAGCPPTKIGGASGHAPREHRHGPVVSFRRGCWSPFRFPDAPGRICR